MWRHVSRCDITESHSFCTLFRWHRTWFSNNTCHILFQDVIPSWFSSFLNDHGLCVASIFSPKFAGMWQCSVLSLFCKLIPLLISSCLMVLNIILMLTAFILLLWTAPLNSSIVYTNWASLSGCLGCTSQSMSKIKFLNSNYLPTNSSHSLLYLSPKTLDYTLLLFFFLSSHLFSEQELLQDILIVWPHLLISILTNFILIIS